MAATSQTSREALRGALIFFVMWLVCFVGFATMFLEFRTSNAVTVLERTYEGPEAMVAMGALVILPVTLLALAIRRFHQYFQTRRDER